MPTYHRFVRATTKECERHVREAVERIVDAVPDKLFAVRSRPAGRPTSLSIIMQIADDARGPDYVLDAVVVDFVTSGYATTRMDLSCDPRAEDFCLVLLRQLDKVWLVRGLTGSTRTRQKEGAAELHMISERGPNAGTPERVSEAHRLIRDQQMKHSAAFKRAGTDSRTYYRWCEKVTGEQPIPARSS